MLTEKYFGNFFMPQIVNDGGDDSGETDSSVFFEEQQVTTAISDKTWPTGVIDSSNVNTPETLIINFEGQEYTLQRKELSETRRGYGCSVRANGVPMFQDELPFLVVYDGTAWTLSTANEGAYTISARLPDPDPEPEPTPEPKRKGRSSIISQLTRLVKALGGNARKSSRTIASQLSALADLAEAGGIGGGGDVLVVHATLNENYRYVLDKTWKEIKDAPIAVLTIAKTGKGDGTHWSLSIPQDFEYVPADDATLSFYGVDFGKNGAFGTTVENGYPISMT